MIEIGDLKKLKEAGKVVVLDPKRTITQRYISQMIQNLGDKAMTAKELGIAMGLKKTPSKVRYYERIGYLKAITIEGKKEIHYVRGEKAINYTTLEKGE